MLMDKNNRILLELQRKLRKMQNRRKTYYLFIIAINLKARLLMFCSRFSQIVENIRLFYRLSGTRSLL